MSKKFRLLRLVSPAGAEPACSRPPWAEIGDGWTFDELYRRAPPIVRYAIVEDAQGRILTWDLYRVAMRMTRPYVEPKYVRCYDNLEEAIARTVMTYNDN
jgi:hypothetical protein